MNYVSNFEISGVDIKIKDSRVDNLLTDVLLKSTPRKLSLKSVSMAGRNTRQTYYQGMCATPNGVALFTNNNELTFFDMKAKTIKSVNVTDFGHGNALAYNDKDNTIHVATLEPFLTVYDVANNTSTRHNLSNPKDVVAGVGIDGKLSVYMVCPKPSNGYISALDTIKCHVYLNGKDKIKDFYLTQPYDKIYAIQGTCLFDGCLYVACTLDTGVDARQVIYTYDLNGNIIDAYYSNIHDDGKYLEIEDICFKDGIFYAGFNSYYVSMIWCDKSPIYNPYVTYDNEEFCFCDGSAERPYKMRTVIGINKFILAPSRNNDQTCNLIDATAEITLTNNNSSVRAIRSNVKIIGKDYSCKIYSYDCRVNCEGVNLLDCTIVCCNFRTKLSKLSGHLTVSQGSFLSLECDITGGTGHLYSQSVIYANANVLNNIVADHSIKVTTP